MALSSNLRGALLMSIAMAAFTLNDTLIKVAAQHMNMGQAMFIRGLFATTLIAVLARHRGALKDPRAILHPLVAMRAIGELGGTLCYLVALAQLPLGNVQAIFQALPLAVTMGAALVLGEYVGWRRWLAIAIGFVGILIIVRPGFEGFSRYSLYTLGCVGFCTLRDLATYRLSDSVPTFYLSTVMSASVTLFGAALIAPMGGWSPLQAGPVLHLVGAGVLLLVGYQTIIGATRAGEISAVAPFRYTALLWALVLGFLVFGDRPDTAILAGSALVVGSGIYMVYRERVAGRTRIVAETTNADMIPDGM